MPTTHLFEPNIRDVIVAKRRIASHIHRTPLRRTPGLCDLLDADVWVKHENMQQLGAFKVRGGINLVSQTTDEERRRGFVTASTGNHGQSMAYAAQAFGARCTIVVPEAANPVKIQSMKHLGATVIEQGEYFDISREYSETLAREEGMRYVHPANEPLLIAGVATYTLEIYQELNDVDFIIVPIGAGSGACGAAIVTEALSPQTQIVGVQSDAAPAVQLSWEKSEGETVSAPMETAAEGLATASAYDYPVGMLRKHLSDFVLVSETNIQKAIVTMLRTTRSVVEHAGAAPLAAAQSIQERIKGKRVVLIASGGNLSVDQLRDILNRYSAE